MYIRSVVFISISTQGAYLSTASHVEIDFIAIIPICCRELRVMMMMMMTKLSSKPDSNDKKEHL